jgi:hypothetical protein
MVKRVLKSFGVTCLLFSGAIALFLIGILFRILGEVFGYHNGESIAALFLVVFMVSYLFVWGNEQ